ncbi:hypothetical protein VTI74DRAFT_9063 [Chaetomium olivicolor]
MSFLFLYICKPMAFYWDWSIERGTCANQQAVFDSANILNISTDFLILLLPIWMRRPLRVPLLEKIGIALILMTGGFVCGISTMRMVTALKGVNDRDITWHYPINLIWCLVEEYVGIVCTCLPCLKAFSKRFFSDSFLFLPAFVERRNASNNGGRSGGGCRSMGMEIASMVMLGEEGLVEVAEGKGRRGQ